MNPSSLRLEARAGVAVLLAVVWAQTIMAQPLQPQELAQVRQSLSPVVAPVAVQAPAAVAEPPRLSFTAGGHLRSIGAPPGQHFVPPNGLVAGQPANAARSFLLQRGRWFGIQSRAVDFSVTRNRQKGTRNYVRLQQLYQTIPIVAAEAVVQVDAQGGIECVLGDLETDTGQLDNGAIALQPVITANAAVTTVKELFSTQAGGRQIQTTVPVLSLFAPSVLNETGPQQLVWDLVVFTDNRSVVDERVLLDAITGRPARVWTQRHTALNRQISDKTNNPTGPATVVRTEGQAPCGIADADNLYTFLGDTYNYYLLTHGRDSSDGAGAALAAISRYCDTNNECPWLNAAAGSPMIFGSGYVADDIVAHEVTHNVTAFESKLIYTNESGAINESLSDVWGEFVDLSNAGGTDTLGVRWLIGEDRTGGGGGAFRSMRAPTNFMHPDRFFSPLYQSPTNVNDNGGVHRNSGVNNKLCYLLTDGDTFNGYTIFSNSMTAVAQLYYEAQVDLLTSGSGWNELYNALTQAAVNNGWSVTNRNNLYRACLAVEIATEARNLYVDKTSGCLIPTGNPICVFGVGPYPTVGQGVSGANPGDVLHIRTGNYNEPMTIEKILTLQTVNGAVTIGQ